MPNRTVGHLP
jgi:hypothetical protein